MAGSCVHQDHLIYEQEGSQKIALFLGENSALR